MGLVSDVVSALREAGIRAEAAWPGRRMPAITGPVAAVCMEQADYSAEIYRVRVTVFSPADRGGRVCEATAEAAAGAVATLRADCVQGICRFDADADCYCIPITATFCTVRPAVSAFSVTQGSTVLDGAVGFTAWREADPDKGISLEDAVWQFRLEEEFAPGQSERVVTAAPFQLTVTRAAGVEVFSGCAWTEVNREDSQKRLRQIRIGTAGSRSYTAR